MPEPKIQHPGAFYEGIPFVIQARVVDKTQTVQSNSTLSSNYTLNVYDISTHGSPTLVHTETQAASNVTFQAISATNGWDKDDDGWNVQLAVYPAAWTVSDAVGGKQYKFELTVTVSASSENIPIDVAMPCLGRAGT